MDATPAAVSPAPLSATGENDMPNLGPMEIGLIVLVVLLLFGATRLPKLGRSMGQSIRGFKKGLNEEPPDDEPETPADGKAVKDEKDDAPDKT
jgi:sec-independent protein translocase protein TatA